MTEEANEVTREEPHAEPNEAASDTGIPDGEDPPKDRTNGTAGASSGKDLHGNDVPLVDRPGFQKLVAALLCLVTVAVSTAMIALVFMARGSDGGDWHTAFSTVSIGLFGVLITGLFVFMAFRIDRGARWEAQRVAKKAVKEMRNTARKRAGKVATKKAGRVAAKNAGKVAAEIAEEMTVEIAKGVAAEIAKGVAAEIAKEVATENAKKVAADIAKKVATENAKKVADEAKEEAEITTKATKRAFDGMVENMKRALEKSGISSELR